jgi:hypothetical protein
MAMYRKCHLCGANLDPGEMCDCQNSKDQNDIQTENTMKYIVRNYEQQSSIAFLPGRSKCNNNL